jgi:hypothetical protein
MRDDRDLFDASGTEPSPSSWRAPILAGVLFLIGIISLVMPLILKLWGIR